MYTITFHYEQQEQQPVLLQNVKEGQSLLEVALQNSIALSHTCGGVCFCSTCHVYIGKGQEFLSEMERREKDFMKKASRPKPNSRLACQCLLLKGSGTVEIIIPAERKV